MNRRFAPRPHRALGMVLLTVVLALAATSAAQTEKILDTPTGWVYGYGASAASITNDINGGLRPFTIKRVGAGTYDVVSVANSGDYAVAGFGTGNMHYNRTAAQLGSDLAGRRLVSLDCYEVLGQTQMTAISVPNSGGSAAGWGWLVGQSRQQIVDWVANTTPALRITDLSIYTVGGQKYYSAVAVYNQGAQYQGWWWYFDKTNEEIADLLTQNSARLIDIELETPPTLFSPARFACVMVAENPGGGWFNASLSSQQVNDLVGQTGGRVTNLHRYTTALGSTRYAVSLVDNANQATRRLRDYMAAEATVGTYGFKLKRVGGPVLLSLNENFVFEPASSMKILHAAYAIRECALGNRALGDDIFVLNRCTTTWWNNVCPDEYSNCDQGYEPLSATIGGMMRSSHNGRTHTLEDLFTRSTLNDFADFTLGLGHTQINHTLGCLCGETSNTTTAADLVDVYEQINDGSLFSGSWRDELHDLMANVTAWGYGSTSDYAFYTLGQVINQEAAGTSLTATEIAAFRAEVRYAVKGGAYECSSTTWRASAGWASLPFKISLGGAWLTSHRNYAFTTFVDGGTDPGSKITYPASEEILREEIRAALESWDSSCSASIARHPGDQTVEEGQDAQFTALAGGNGSADYQWQKNANGSWLTLLNLGGQTSGATTGTLTIHAVEPGDAGLFRCRITKPCGTVNTVGAELTVTPNGLSPVPGSLPAHLVMHDPMPNPFNPLVTLRFELPANAGRATLEVFDVAGRRVRTLSTAALEPGAHEFTWNGTDDGGRRVSSGAYLVRMQAGGEVATRRVMLIE